MIKSAEMKILWGMIAVYVLVMGTVVCLRHYDFQTQTWDLAAFDQSFWNAAHGRGLVNNLEQVHNHLGLHFSPGLFLLVPGYALFPSPYYLLLMQTLALALGAWPLYLLAKRHLRGRWPLIVAGAYLLYPSLQWANMYDFHEITFFVPLMLAALYFLEKWLGWTPLDRGRNLTGWMSFLFLALAASMKEDAILAVLFVGVYLLIRKQWKIGLAVTLISLVYFILAVKVFMPALGGGVLRFDRYANFGTTPGEAVKNIFTKPLLIPRNIAQVPKLIYLAWLFAPIAFLPLASWQTLVLLLPGLPEDLLTNYQFQFSGLYHYDCILIPALFVGMIFGLEKILERWPRKERVFQWIVLSLAVGSFLLRAPLGVFSFPASYFTNNPQWTAYRELVNLVPDGVSVAANTNMVPHLTHRENVHALGLEPAPADFVLIDAADPFGFKTQEDFQHYLDGYAKSGLYHAQTFENRYIVVMSNKFKLAPQSQ